MKWLSAPFALLIAIPLVALVVSTSPGRVWSALLQPDTLDALAISLRTTLVSLAILVVFATPLAWTIGRGPRLARGVFGTLAELPAVLPPSVAGIALLVAFGHEGLIGKHLGFEIPFTATAVVLAQLFVASPFFLRPAAEGFAALDNDVLEAGRLDGASGLAYGFRLVWPMARRPYVAGLCLAWARALGEFGATLLFAGSFQGVTRTAPLAIYDAFETDLETAKAIGVVLLLVAALVLAAAKWGLREKA